MNKKILLVFLVFWGLLFSAGYWLLSLALNNGSMPFKENQSAKQQKNIGAKVDLTAYDSLISFGHVHPEKKDFLLSIFDLETKKIVSTVNLGDIFTRKIYYNKKEMQIWIPVSFQKDIKYVSNKVKILDMKNGTVEELEVGLSPVDIRFVNDVAVITCLERGIGDVSTYLIDAKKFKIIDKVMIGGDVFEFGETDVQNDKAYLITEDVENRISIVSVLNIGLTSIEQFEYPNIPLHGLALVNEDLWLAGGNQILIIDPATGKTKERIQTDIIAYQLDFNGEVVLLSHYYPDTQQQRGLSIVNPNTLKTRKVSLGDTLPSSMTLKANQLYLVDEMSGLLNVFDIKTAKLIYSVELGKFPTNIIYLD